MACCRGEESQQATLPHSRQRRSATHWVPSSRQAWQYVAARHVGDRVGQQVVAGRRRSSSGGLAYDADLVALLPRRLSSIDSSTSRRREHVGDHLGRDVPDLRISRIRRRSASIICDPDPVVEGGRRLLVGGGAEPLPGREVALVEPLPDQVDDARAGRRTRASRAPRSAALDACWSSVARASASSSGSGDGTLSRRANHGSVSPWISSVPATTVKAISQQHLAVRRCSPG